MSVKEVATDWWTQLLEGLRADGLIAQCVTASGPATTSVIVQMVQAMVPNEQRGPWLPASIRPAPNLEVVGMDANGDVQFICFDVSGNSYVDRFGSEFTPIRYTFLPRVESAS